MQKSVKIGDKAPLKRESFLYTLSYLYIWTEAEYSKFLVGDLSLVMLLISSCVFFLLI